LPDRWRRFVVIRDLRDTLVSAYFSVRESHRAIPHVEGFRSTLQEKAEEDGMLHLMDQWLDGCARIQESWVEGGEPLTLS
jgi:lipopolysaccharide transport system ATP-binding protein